MNNAKDHRTLLFLFRMLLVCAAEMFLVAGASGQARESGSSALLGCPDDVHLLPTQRWVRDMRQKSFRGIKKLLSADIVFSDNGKTFRGSAAVNDVYRHAFAAFDSQLVMSPTAHIWDNAQRTCTETGRFEEDLRTRTDGTTKHYSGGYVFAFKLVGNRWKISRQEWTDGAEMQSSPR